MLKSIQACRLAEECKPAREEECTKYTSPCVQCVEESSGKATTARSAANLAESIFLDDISVLHSQPMIA